MKTIEYVQELLKTEETDEIRLKELFDSYMSYRFVKEMSSENIEERENEILKELQKRERDPNDIFFIVLRKKKFNISEESLKRLIEIYQDIWNNEVVQINWCEIIELLPKLSYEQYEMLCDTYSPKEIILKLEQYEMFNHKGEKYDFDRVDIYKEILFDYSFENAKDIIKYCNY